MRSATLALFVRSFRIDARSVQAHLARLLFVAVIALSLLSARTMSFVISAPGLAFFKQICWLNFFLISLAGVGFFSTAISEEKEEETLGLLRMAGISPVALLLGKSTTRMLSVLMILAVQFPFILLSITLGGVSHSQVLAAAAALVAYLLFIANLGLFFSVLCSTSRRASTLTTVVLVGLLIVEPIFSLIWHATPWGAVAASSGGDAIKVAITRIVDAMDAVSIIDRISAILNGGFSDYGISPQVIFHTAAAATFFGLSWLLFDRFTRVQHAPGRIERLFFEPLRRKRRARIGRAWTRALTWKDFYFVAGGMRLLVTRFLLYGAIIGGISYYVWTFAGRTDPFDRVLGDTAMMSMLIAGAVELSLFASRFLRDEVQEQTLPLLMMLPTTTTRLAWSKAAAVGPLLVPTLFYFVLGALVYPAGFRYGFKETLSELGSYSTFVWFILFLHLAAYLSLRVKWAALPAALFLTYLMQMMIMMAYFAMRLNGPNDGQLFALNELCLGLAGIVVLELAIHHRLEHLAKR